MSGLERKETSRFSARRMLRTLLVAAFLIYFGTFFSVIIRQRAILFRPPKATHQTPKDLGIAFDTVRIPVGGNQSIEAWWVPFETSSDSKILATHPTLVYCHGNAGVISLYTKVVKIFHDNGWNLLIFDYRGYGNSDSISQVTEETARADSDAAYAFALSKVPEDSVFIWGHSLGSAIAASLAARHNPVGLIVEGPFPSLYRMARLRYPYYPIFPWMVFDTFETKEFLAHHSFPVLHIHAALDSIIPLPIGQEFYSSLPEPKQQLIIPDINHNGFPDVHQLYDQHLKTIVDQWIEQRRSNDTIK